MSKEHDEIILKTSKKKSEQRLKKIQDGANKRLPDTFICPHLRNPDKTKPEKSVMNN